MNTTTIEGHPTSERLAKAAHETVDKVASVAGQAEEKLRAKSAQAVACGGELSEQIADYVRAHPLATLGAAAALGLLIGSLLRRH